MIKILKKNLIFTQGKRILFYILIAFLLSIIFKSKLIFLLTVFFTLFSIYFFRNPERRAYSKDICSIISPADGKIVDIDLNYDKLAGYNKKISIFLSPFDVHVNWIPISGKIEKIEYKKGDFSFAFTDKSSELNERNDIIIKDDKSRKILVRQIAGTIARRIVCWIKNGDYVNLGDKYGMIKFGSRVDILLPKDVIIKVNLSEHVIGGETVIGKWQC